jgi:uncharacterized protein (DUF433 family)/DNA-binding transcriptional MerR regulator
MTAIMNTVISAFSEDHVERLTGLSVHQLRHWDRTGFYTPAFADPNRRVAYSRVYSFKDIAALRVLSVLRNQYNVSLQHLRQVSAKLAHLSDDKWTKTTLYVLKRKVLFTDPETGVPVEIVSGQYALGIPLNVVLSDTAKDVAKLRVRDDAQVGVIERNRWVAHNSWVIAGTRIPVEAIKSFHRAGYSVANIIAEYPDLTRRDVEAAVAHKEKSAA